MNLFTFLVVCGSVWGLFQLLAVLIGWRFTRMRPTLDAVLVERIAQPGFGESVWAGLDRALAEPWDDDGNEAVAHWSDCGCPDCHVFAVDDDIDALVDAINGGRDLDILLTHEALPEVDEIGAPDRWMALEAEFADLGGLAAELGERAS
jgi:hypothetical protein